jgi:hypothetical protein
MLCTSAKLFKKSIYSGGEVSFTHSLTIRREQAADHHE